MGIGFDGEDGMRGDETGWDRIWSGMGWDGVGRDGMA